MSLTLAEIQALPADPNPRVILASDKGLRPFYIEEGQPGSNATDGDGIFESEIQTMTNKTLGTGTKINVAQMILGGDSTGDMYFRNSSGNLTRLPIGINGNVLYVNSNIPSWTNSPTFGSITVTGTFTHNGTVSITNSASWRAAVDVGLAPPINFGGTTVGLATTNSMSVGVVECSSATAVNVQINNIDNIKVGDAWEVCQAAAGILTLVGTTSVAGQVVTLQFPPGGGPKSSGLFTTLFVRVRAKAGSGAGATATVLVTGGAP